MKRSTWITLSVFGLLLAAYLLQSRHAAPNTPAALSIDGYVGNLSEQEARSQAKDKPSPVTRIVIGRKGEVIALERVTPPEGAADAADAAKPEAKWTARRTKDAKTTDSKALSFRAQSMSETLMRSIRSSFSTHVAAKNLADYGLDADHALDVEITLPPRTVKLRIGQVEKPEQGEPSTWVMDPARPEVAYQIAGRDLRTGFDVAWSELRDKALLNLDGTALEHIEIANPAATTSPRIVLDRAPLTETKRKELQDKMATRGPAEGWAFTEPKGQDAGDIGEWLKAVERLSASEFVDTADAAAKKADTGLDDTATVVRVTLASAKDKTVLLFGKSDESRPTRDVWVRIEGRDELFLVPTFNRDQVVQTADQLRDRRLLGGHKAKDSTSLQIEPTTDAVRIKATRKDETWTVSEPTMKGSSQAIIEFLGDLDSTKVEFVGDRTQAAGLLGTPVWKISLELDGEAWTLALGKETDSAVYGRVDHGAMTGDIFKLTTWNANRLKKKPADFADKPAAATPSPAVPPGP